MKKVFNKEILQIVASLILFVLALILGQTDIWWLPLPFYLVSLLVAGGRVFIDAVRGILRRDLLDEKFLMSIASIGAMIVGEWSEGVAVMIFFLVGETFEHYAVRKSRNSIRALMDICPDEACVLIDGEEQTLDAEDVEVGSTIIIRPGERVPVDSVVVFGSAHVDTSSMTGEPLPVSVTIGSELCSGYIVKDGLLHAKTLRLSSESSASRILELVENANENKSKEEAFITKFSRYYTPIVVIIALLVAILPPILKLSDFPSSIYTSLTFLVISCPCALVISVPMAFFGGIGGAASSGILFKGGNVFSRLTKLETVAFDKTGTLTNGNFTVSDVKTFDVSKERLLSLVASAEQASNHPIADCLKNLSTEIINPTSVEEIAGFGVVANLDDASVSVGNRGLMERLNVNISKANIESEGSVFVAENERLIGVLSLSDSVKQEAKAALESLKALGVRRTVILSGDREENVKLVADSVGITEIYPQLKPEEKYYKLEELISTSKSTMYVGDGINDSPSIARADVGVAMGSMGQDSAIEAADMVIMSDNLSKISVAVKIARKTVNISWQNIIFALGTKIMILILGLIGCANMWLAVFADVGVAVLAILNSMRALKVKK